MHTPKYKLCRWPHGWSVEPGNPVGIGIPVGDFVEISQIVGQENAVMDPGLTNHLKTSGHPRTITVIGEPKELDIWAKEVEAKLHAQTSDPEEKWFRGTDTGLSSLAIFATLATRTDLKSEALSRTRGETPADCGDLGRCLRLLEKMPGWEARLPEVSARWPLSAWNKLVPQWAELKASTREKQREILNAANGRT
jgi:hypothetical protein